MKFRTLTLVTAMMFAVPAIPLQTAAQEKPHNKPRHHHYKLIDLGTFGGPQSYVNIPPSSYAQVLNNGGVATGWADTSVPDPFPNFCFNPDCFISHAFQWHEGEITDLRALPNGASSSSAWITSNGLTAGASQNGQIDPLIPGFPEVRAVLWTDGNIADLGTLEGGYESAATAVNNQGMVVGLSINTIPDPFPIVDGGASQGLGYQTRAFLSLNGTMEDLGTLGTGTDATAYLINEKGQVAGDSFTDQTSTTSLCGTNVPRQDPFFWDSEHGMIDVGTLGGVCGFAFALNTRGQVVGQSDLSGDQQAHAFVWDPNQTKPRDLGTFGGKNSVALANNDAGHVTGWAALPGDKSIRAFLWKDGKKTNLGALHNDGCSQGYSLNSSDQVVGSSIKGCDFVHLSASTAFLWEKGEGIVDLNTLVSPGSDLHLATEGTINDRGEIAGIGVLPNGDEHAFLLIPCSEEQGSSDDCEGGDGDIATATQDHPAAVPQSRVVAPNISAARSTGRRALRAGMAHRFRTPTTR